MPLSSGPYRIQSWTKGQQLVLAKNPRFKAWSGGEAQTGSCSANIPSTPSIFQALQAGEVQVMTPQPADPDRGPCTKDKKFKVQTTPAFQWQQRRHPA
jgi:ABC-type transport system substrate-binding protein